MEFTGERVVPDAMDWDDPILIQHLARYGFATAYATHKDVLDVCCGTGYGSAMMASVAHSVTGFDISHEAIAYAVCRYPYPNTTFTSADVFDWVPRAEYDVAVCFEALEHVEDGERFIEVVHGALTKPNSSLVLSIPAPRMCETNPFHKRCYTQEELEALLAGRFEGTMLGQEGQTIAYGLVNPDFYIFAGSKIWCPTSYFSL